MSLNQFLFHGHVLTCMALDTSKQSQTFIAEAAAEHPCYLIVQPFMLHVYAWGAETEQTLAPRRQSLPQPHASPSVIPAWAPTGPDTANHTMPSTYASCNSIHDRASCMPDEAQDAHIYQEAAFSSTSDLGPGKYDRLAAARMSASRQPIQTGQGSGDQHCPSPGCGSYQAAPAVNITITGACSCMSPAKTSPSIEAHEQASQAAEHQSAVKLHPEASLAYLHQPAGDSGPTGEHSHTGNSAASCSSAVSPGAVPQEETAGGRQTDQVASGGIDTAALQKEVTELRQQASMPAPTCRAFLHQCLSEMMTLVLHLHMPLLYELTCSTAAATAPL